MYKTIVDPKTNRKVSINSKLGKKILNKYINLIGGAAARQYQKPSIMEGLYDLQTVIQENRKKISPGILTDLYEVMDELELIVQTWSGDDRQKKKIKAIIDGNFLTKGYWSFIEDSLREDDACRYWDACQKMIGWATGDDMQPCPVRIPFHLLPPIPDNSDMKKHDMLEALGEVRHNIILSDYIFGKIPTFTKLPFTPDERWDIFEELKKAINDYDGSNNRDIESKVYFLLKFQPIIHKVDAIRAREYSEAFTKILSILNDYAFMEGPTFHEPTPAAEARLADEIYDKKDEMNHILDEIYDNMEPVENSGRLSDTDLGNIYDSLEKLGKAIDIFQGFGDTVGKNAEYALEHFDDIAEFYRWNYACDHYWVPLHRIHHLATGEPPLDPPPRPPEYNM